MFFLEDSIKMEDYIVVIYLRNIIQSPKEKLHRINPLFRNVVKWSGTL